MPPIFPRLCCPPPYPLGLAKCPVQLPGLQPLPEWQDGPANVHEDGEEHLCGGGGDSHPPLQGQELGQAYGQLEKILNTFLLCGLKVSWIQPSAMAVISAGHLVFSSDQRVGVMQVRKML